MTIEWSEELVTDICDHLSTGKAIADVARLQGYPSADSIYRQMYRDAAFAARIARAREAGQDHEADAIVSMADVATVEDWQVVKLRMEARKWRAAKLAPKKFGERQTVEHTDPDGNNPFGALMEAVASNGRPRPGP
jgi:hypothetical protein